MRTRIALLALSCVVTSAAAQAADNGFYLGLGAERASFDLDDSLDKADTGYKLVAGVRLLDSFAVEADYAEHGKAKLPSGIACVALVGVDCPDTSNLKANSTALYGVGFLDFPVLDLFAKAGVGLVDSSLHTPGNPGFGDSSKKAKFAWGAGIQGHFLSIAVRAEFEQFRVIGNEKLNVASASFIYTFL